MLSDRPNYTHGGFQRGAGSAQHAHLEKQRSEDVRLRKYVRFDHAAGYLPAEDYYNEGNFKIHLCQVCQGGTV